jgi:hypothetical protein
MTYSSLIFVRSATIGDAEITSSNVPEVAPAEYNSGTTYGSGTQVTVFSGVSNTTAAVYQSLQASNLNHTPASSPTWWRLVGYTYATFVLGGPGGAGYGSSARVVDSTNHLVYESLVNTNTADLADGASWAEVGPTNKWAMFDRSNSTQSEAEQQIAVTLTPSGRVDSVSLFGLEAATVTITASTVAAGTFYSQSFDLTETSGIDSWYDWFFEPVVRRDQLIVSDIPAYLDPTITITIDNGTATAKVGTMIIGQGLDLGLTLADAGSGIVSYSKIDVNEWGDYELTQRKSVKKISLRVVVDNVNVDKVRRQLASFDAVPTSWRGTEEYSSLAVYGIFRSFSIAFSYPTQSICSIDLEGIT